jgi:UDP-glucose 4-epimerase
VEIFSTEFFRNHPEITFTVLRVGMLCGPNIRSMFSKLWSMKISALPMGSNAYLQLIHEEDLGDALYLSYLKEVPGIFNVAADDAVPTKWCYRQAGVFVIPLPIFLLKPLADIGFKLKLFPAGSGWVSLLQYTMFTLTNKFKKASGWHPKYTSKETFETYLASRIRDAKDNFIQSILSWVFVSGARIRPTLSVLQIFKLGKIKAFRNIQPWMSPKKNSMTYLPISYKPETTTRKIPVEESAGESASEILPPRIVHDFIEKAEYHVIMDHCGCRLSGECEHFTADIGCLFMGETALNLPHGVSRRVTKEQAHKHVERAIGVGLVPVVGKIRVDNFIFLTPDKNRLLSVCFCCHCCCMMGAFKHLPGDHLDNVMTPLEGVHIEVTDDCNACGTCLETCIFEDIIIEIGKSRHSNKCRACGRCVTYCPQDAVKITIENPTTFTEIVKQRIESYVKVA